MCWSWGWAHADSHFLLALIYRDTNKTKDSLDEFGKAIEMDKLNPIIYDERGDLFYKDKKTDQAYGDYTEALALDKKDKRALLGIGTLLKEQGEYEKALIYLNNACGLASKPACDMIIAYSVSSLPFSIWILKGYYDTIPRSLEEAAMVDGTTRFGAFYRVVLPLSTPALAIAFLFNFTSAWNEYLVARVILTDSYKYTWTLGLFELQGQFTTQWGMFAAGSVLVTIPVLAVFLYSSKWLISGLTLGSVKG